jgi:hypothetical protein
MSVDVGFEFLTLEVMKNQLSSGDLLATSIMLVSWLAYSLTLKMDMFILNIN